MQSILKLVRALVVSLGCLHLTACSTTTAADAKPVRYFATFSGAASPTQPIGEITKEESEKWRAYYVASYDSAGRPTTVEKILDGKRYLLWEYTYHANGKLASARISNREGKATVLNYDQNGNAIGASR